MYFRSKYTQKSFDDSDSIHEDSPCRSRIEERINIILPEIGEINNSFDYDEQNLDRPISRDEGLVGRSISNPVMQQEQLSNQNFNMDAVEILRSQTNGFTDFNSWNPSPSVVSQINVLNNAFSRQNVNTPLFWEEYTTVEEDWVTLKDDLKQEIQCTKTYNIQPTNNFNCENMIKMPTNHRAPECEIEEGVVEHDGFKFKGDHKCNMHLPSKFKAQNQTESVICFDEIELCAKAIVDRNEKMLNGWNENQRKEFFKALKINHKIDIVNNINCYTHLS